MTVIAERVAAGAAFLDEHDPQWWRPDVDRAIDLDALNLAATSLCVLGQRCPLEVLAILLKTDVEELDVIDMFDAYDAYSMHLSGLDGMGLAYWARDHGFTFISDPANGVDDPADWDDLTAEWKCVITERRSAS